MANTVLSWNDSNSGHLGYKLRKADLPYMDPGSMSLVETLGPEARNYLGPPGAGVEFWRVGAYDADQETQSDKLALSFPIKIMTIDVLISVMNKLDTVGTGFGPYHPNGGTVGSWVGGPALTSHLLVTTAGGVTLAIDASGVHRIALEGGIPTRTKLADQLAGTSTVRWAAALPNGKVVYDCQGVGYGVFDPIDNSVVLGLSRTSDQGHRGVYAQDLGKIILAGGTGSPSTDVLRFLILDPVTWTIETVDVSGVTGGSSVTGGLLVAGSGRAHYWAQGANVLAALTWDGDGFFSTSSVVAPAYPSSDIGFAQGLPLDTGEFLAIGGGNAYRISGTGVAVDTVSTYVGAEAAGFTDSVTGCLRTPDGGCLFMGNGGTKFLYFNGHGGDIAVVSVPNSGGFRYTVMLDGRVFFFSSSLLMELTWVDDEAPPLNFPSSYLASQYNCQGRNPYV